ncbi:MAG: M20/M25/M40 family metallo-hydrolase [Halolamina sp.]
MTTDRATETPTEALAAREADHFEDLFELLAQPSLSATGEGVDPCADLAADLCTSYGFDEAVKTPTDGAPAVLARADADTDAEAMPDDDPESTPTVLLYGHYDVQPADPAEWESPPFEPTVREGPDGRERLYARGAGDNKGQWFAHLRAVDALRATTGLPANVVLLLEGEEESGSPNLDSIVADHADLLAADLAVVADGPIDVSGRPTVLLGARGLLYVQIDVEGPNRDLHSGNYGGPVPNPAWELVRLVGSLKDADGRVAVDGFYEDVRSPTAADRDAVAALSFDEAMAEVGVDALADGPGESYGEKLLSWPTANIAGLAAGYGGEGSKTVLPASATAKLDFRLVADQEPDALYEKVRRHLDRHASGRCAVSVRHHGMMHPQRTPLTGPVQNLAETVTRLAWEDDPVVKPTLGGSLPTAVFERELDAPVVVLPYANSDENNHSSDENIVLDCHRAGARTTVELLRRLPTADLDDAGPA